MANEYDGVRYEEEYILNSRGMKLFTCSWLPIDCEPKALIFLCHGYAMECSISMKDTGIRLAKAGFGVYGMDYEGHGKSAGLQGFVSSFDAVVDDCSDHYSKISERKENKKKMRILMGESMGGAVALLLHRKKSDFWDGAVLIAPMCKIADDMRPSPIVISILTKLCNIIPTWKLIPTQDVVDSAFRDPEVRKEIRNNPYCYKGRPRLQTGYQLFTVSMDLEQRLEEVTLPFLIVHGGEDTVTDPSVSKLLYEKASSIDKSFKLYPGMWHSLSYGEFPENRNIVFSDIISWLNEKISMGNSRLERQQKHANDNLSKISS
ncbi:caffeoylshikimate esterase-like [Nicotiana sylvestris]|uniref:Caffeoylshikimate esterase-like n=1 Tax=Nicotiana sylvestris TaxID=4096 RepID=A0A1U7W978_NICSY|nr:PREDICTED: caffeoylshikimate esterase-like [Nicotiana sylvestris]